ncbi:unnamed protein product [Schistosoma curassoni]|uniref:ABC transmembrane type-1 domain-containing protein n=1 Tax=Schistosoma curassoni TaxID=6186 RepID=A0A183KSA4_9TREM|nr:unnamed protein product [Schistosoma curassoni]
MRQNSRPFLALSLFNSFVFGGERFIICDLTFQGDLLADALHSLKAPKNDKALGVQNMVVGQLSLILREILTKNLQSLYFKRKNYYVVNTLTDLDNPDQRLTQDINLACDLLTNIIVSITVNPTLVVFYTYLCVQKAGWLGPVSAYILFIIFAIISRFVASWSSRASFERQKQEGNFRFVHTKLRCSVESAAFLDLSESLNAISTNSFNRLFHAVRVFINRNAVVFYLTQLNAYCGGVVNYVALGIILFNGPIRTMSASEITVLISQVNRHQIIRYVYTNFSFRCC